MAHRPGSSPKLNAQQDGSPGGGGSGGGSGGGAKDGFLADLFQTRYREVTASAILFAIVIGVIMNAAITYAGLKMGFTIGGSAIAAVLGFGVLRGVLRKGSVLETNIAQTAASAINTSNSGVIFTVPVLFLLGIPLVWNGADFWLITLACIGGAILGAAFIIPLRKQMIEIDRLRFPTGMGVAAILKSPGAGPKKSLVLVIGIVIAALLYLPAALPAIKSPARVDDLDRLFAAEKISWTDVERTRAIAGWIDTRSIPADVLARGAQLEEIERARLALDTETDAELRMQIRDSIEALQTGLAELPVVGPFGDALAHRAFEVNAGEREWESLRAIKLGWAGKPLPGYSDLGIRLPARAHPEKPADRDLTGDGNPDTVLDPRVDRDQNGRPDLLVTDDKINLGRAFGLPDQFEMIFAIAPFALGAGFITGRAGLLVLAGGILAYYLLTPIAFGLGWMPETVRAQDAPDYGFAAFNRPLGIGLLLGGALMGVVMSLPAIREALKSVARAGKVKGGGDELGIKVLLAAVVGAAILLFIAADIVGNRPLNTHCPVTNVQVTNLSADDPSASIERPTAAYAGYTIALSNELALETWNQWPADQKDAFLKTFNAKPGWLASLHPHLRAAVLALVGVVWIWLAGIIIAQCTGMTDWSPISGMALLTVVLVMMLAGTGAVVGAVLIGAALCVAITLAADMMADLRTGHLVGAKPKRQQLVELSVVGMGPLIAMLTILIIAQVNIKTTGVAFGPETPTSAPQAQALQAVITGVQGGEMPYALYGFGTLIGALLGLGAFSGLGVLVGLSMYLPFYYIATYGIGCLVNMGLSKWKGRVWSEEWGVPFAAGLIVGESMLAMIINMYVLAQG